MSEYGWNKKQTVIKEFWDTDINSPAVTTVNASLKERLASPHRTRTDDVIGDIAIGLSMIMDRIEKSDELSRKLAVRSAAQEVMKEHKEVLSKLADNEKVD